MAATKDAAVLGFLNGLNVPAALKDSLITALIVLALAVPIIGLRTVTAPLGLDIEQRWGDVLIAVCAAFAGRFLMNIWWASRRARLPGKAAPASPDRC